VPYPVACHPQAWSAASIFMIVQAMLGMQVLGFEQRLVIDSPAMPARLDWLRINDLKVGAGKITFIVHRTAAGAAIEIVEKHGDVSVEVKK
jgi:glycogen debranching enzyme